MPIEINGTEYEANLVIDGELVPYDVKLGDGSGIHIHVDGDAVDDDILTLDATESLSGTLYWEAGEGDAGTYDVTVSSDNDLDQTTVSVEAETLPDDFEDGFNDGWSVVGSQLGTTTSDLSDEWVIASDDPFEGTQYALQDTSGYYLSLLPGDHQPLRPGMDGWFAAAIQTGSTNEAVIGYQIDAGNSDAWWLSFDADGGEANLWEVNSGGWTRTLSYTGGIAAGEWYEVFIRVEEDGTDHRHRIDCYDAGGVEVFSWDSTLTAHSSGERTDLGHNGTGVGVDHVREGVQR